MSLRGELFVALSVLGLVACAPEVVRRPTQLTSVAEQATEQAKATIEIVETVPVSVGPGYRRVIRRGSLWTRIGRSVEGEVFKPVDGVFTVEGAHVHEAYLVLDGDLLVGFYLPVERAFAPVRDGEEIRLSIRRRPP